ncbi:MAG: Gfo/Idh/MocA family oxidoreductase [Candidatus Brocadiaceae bacterium]|mgnify:CR=1 FL=1|nr:Gfo/Idh/MocA family oxidoreductase [Candidatus Brocadiaceae bacterium]
MASKTLKKVRFGIVGAGYIGKWHAQTILKQRSPKMTVGAIADSFGDAAQRAGEQFGIPAFTDPVKMFESGLIDAVIVGTPHFWHAPVAIQAARAGLHVMCEKPLAATIGPARAMVEACRKNGVAMGSMLQLRTAPAMRKIKEMVDGGRLGDLLRVSLVCTSWYRTQAYYASSPWRGTWNGEGGGILQNQAPHQMDVFQWIGGMPSSVTSVMSTRLHDIEVENTAHVVFGYEGEKTGYFFATTSELPGGDTFTLVGDRGTLVWENNTLRFGQLAQPVSKHIFECQEPRADFIPAPRCTWKEVKIPARSGGSHINVFRPFVDHLLKGTPMVASGEDGLNEVELANAAYVSAFKGRTVQLPVDAEEVERVLAKLEKERSRDGGVSQRAEARKALRKLVGS